MVGNRGVEGKECKGMIGVRGKVGRGGDVRGEYSRLKTEESGGIW